MENNCVYTIRDVASILKVSPKTVYGIVRDKEIEYIRVRGQIRITSEQLERYLRGGTSNANKRKKTER